MLSGEARCKDALVPAANNRCNSPSSKLHYDSLVTTNNVMSSD